MAGDGGAGGPSNWAGETTPGPLVPRLIAAGFWCAIVFGLEMIQDLYKTEIQLAEAESASIDAELRMLKAEAVARRFEVRQLQEQMNPHFLFNALNAVVASKHDPEAVESVTRDLADYLRFTLGEARAFLEARPADVVFLDVEMPGGSGFDVLASVPEGTQVVFVTAREKYAVQAFTSSALDYLVKPVDPERLADTIARIETMAAVVRSRADGGSNQDDGDDGDSTAAAAGVGLDDRISVTLAGKTTAAVVAVGEICWIEALRNYTRVALKDPARLTLFRRRLSAWDKVLPGGPFARVGRSYIVQLAAVEQIEWRSRDETVVTFGAGVEPLALGRLPATRLREILGGNKEP